MNKKILAATVAVAVTLATTACAAVPGKGGDTYVPYEERTGNESIVYFTRDLSAAGM